MLNLPTDEVQPLTAEQHMNMRDTLRMLQSDHGEVDTMANLAKWESDNLMARALVLSNSLSCLGRQINKLGLHRI